MYNDSTEYKYIDINIYIDIYYYILYIYIYIMFAYFCGIIPCNHQPGILNPHLPCAWRWPILGIIAQDEDWHRCPEAVVR